LGPRYLDTASAPILKRSTDRILTTHVGALPAPRELESSLHDDPDALRRAVAQTVKAQADVGVDVVNDGELGKGHWIGYLSQRLLGTEPSRDPKVPPPIPEGKDRERFQGFYTEAARQGTLWYSSGSTHKPVVLLSTLVCTSELKYNGAALRDIDNLKAALAGVAVTEAFLPVVAPASVAPYIGNQYYPSERHFHYALADVLRTEYEAIANAGILLQVDDAWTAALWDRIGIQIGIEAYKRRCCQFAEILNHALARIPEDRIRYHICWGSWHGPHAHDLPMVDLLDVILTVKAGAYLFEAANARHEHEYHIWEHVRLPSGKILVPGVVSHATNIVEHPDLVSERIQRFARLVGRENVMAGTDCGLGGRVHPDLVWAKLEALAAGARLASIALWK
jgi:5-methyltetrahydropteroyltriglutamate--homocysteine methyltransferase